MLVLTRRIGERIVIEGAIVITVLRSNPGEVRLGIDAPGRTVDRAELHVRKQRLPQPARGRP